MKLVSWNINGIRAVIRKGFLNFLRRSKYDVVCLQEIKIGEAMREKEGLHFPGWQEFWNSAERPGYSGTLTLVREGIDVNGKNGFGIKKFDIEGRCQTLEFDDFYLLNNYFPNANNELSRLDYKVEYNKEFLKYAKKLEKKKPVIFCGDLNVAHEEIDLARPKANIGKAGFTIQEREWMDKFIEAGFRDTYRELNGDKVQYTWWSYRGGARFRNVGWRIDYFCVSQEFLKNIKESLILDRVDGSDHCPVEITVAQKRKK